MLAGWKGSKCTFMHLVVIKFVACGKFIMIFYFISMFMAFIFIMTLDCMHTGLPLKVPSTYIALYSI